MNTTDLYCTNLNNPFCKDTIAMIENLNSEPPEKLNPEPFDYINPEWSVNMMKPPTDLFIRGYFIYTNRSGILETIYLSDFEPVLGLDNIGGYLIKIHYNQFSTVYPMFSFIQPPADSTLFSEKMEKGKVFSL